jgi:hypothetical protein
MSARREPDDGALREHLRDRAVDAALFGELPSAEERLASRESGSSVDFAREFDLETESFERLAARLAVEAFDSAGTTLEPMPEAVRARLHALAGGIAAMHAATTTNATRGPAAIAPAPIRLADRVPSRRRAARDWIVAAASVAFGATCALLVLEARNGSSIASRDTDSVPASFEAAAFLRGHPNAVHWPWTSTGDAMSRGSVAGEAYFDPATGEGALVIDGLSANDPTRAQYQLWIFDRARDERYPVDGGVFDVGADGTAVVPIRTQLAVREPYLFAVTVEKPGGVVVSERRIAILAKP